MLYLTIYNVPLKVCDAMIIIAYIQYDMAVECMENFKIETLLM